MGVLGLNNYEVLILENCNTYGLVHDKMCACIFYLSETGCCTFVDVADDLVGYFEFCLKRV